MLQNLTSLMSWLLPDKNDDVLEVQQNEDLGQGTVNILFLYLRQQIRSKCNVLYRMRFYVFDVHLVCSLHYLHILYVFLCLLNDYMQHLLL